MFSNERKLQKIYAKLGRVLQSPQSFGLGPDVPSPLAMCLEASLKTLGEAIDEEKNSGRNALELGIREIKLPKTDPLRLVEVKAAS